MNFTEFSIIFTEFINIVDSFILLIFSDNISEFSCIVTRKYDQKCENFDFLIQNSKILISKSIMYKNLHVPIKNFQNYLIIKISKIPVCIDPNSHF